MIVRAMQARTFLAVGATGMLRGALDELARAADRTIVVARHASVALCDQPLPGLAVPLDLDWQRPAPAMAAIEPHISEVDLALLWLHSTGTTFWDALMRRLVTQPRLVVQVLGSRGDPTEYQERVARLRSTAGFRYRTVKLGSVAVGDGRRWLTHEEISDGALRAVREDRDVFVGT